MAPKGSYKRHGVKEAPVKGGMMKSHFLVLKIMSYLGRNSSLEVLHWVGRLCLMILPH